MSSKRKKRCKAYSGFLVGFRCQLDRGHDGQHEAVTSVTHDTFTGREVERETTRWGAVGVPERNEQ